MKMSLIIAIMHTTWAVVKLKPEKIQAWTGFEPMTSAILVHSSTNWAIKPLGAGHFVSSYYARRRRRIHVNIWKFIHLNRGKWYEDVTDHLSYAHNLNSCEVIACEDGGFGALLWHGTSSEPTKVPRWGGYRHALTLGFFIADPPGSNTFFLSS